MSRRGDRWLVNNLEDIPIVGRGKFLAEIYAQSEDIVPLCLFQKCKYISKEVYLHVLQTAATLLIAEVTEGSL